MYNNYENDKCNSHSGKTCLSHYSLSPLPWQRAGGTNTACRITQATCTRNTHAHSPTPINSIYMYLHGIMSRKDVSNCRVITIIYYTLEWVVYGQVLVHVLTDQRVDLTFWMVWYTTLHSRNLASYPDLPMFFNMCEKNRVKGLVDLVM